MGLLERRRFRRRLFPDRARLSGVDRQTQLLEQYKLFVGTSESLVSRRQGENRFFLTGNTLVLGAIGLFLRDPSNATLRAVSVIGLSITGVILAVSWFRMIRSYGQLNRGKFKVIHELERQLPAAIFDAEWVALGEGERSKVYRPFTSVEQGIPVAFGILHVAALILGILLATGTVTSAKPSTQQPPIVCERAAGQLECRVTGRDPARAK